MILYPSISICKRYAITKKLDVLKNVKEMAHNDSEVADIVRSNVTNSVQPLDEQIFFFTHPGVRNLIYPCTTTAGGPTPGKPCIFPVYNGYDVWTECGKWETTRLICFTKISEEQFRNGSHYISHTDNGNWGYCDPKCKGESPKPSSEYNLAKSNYNDLWTSNIYDLNHWENGFCHTYDPPQKSTSDILLRIFFMLSEPYYDDYDYYDDSDENYKDYDIFLHEKGQFWPRLDMMSFGQPDPIQLEYKKELQIVFSIKEITTFNLEEDRCIDNEEYSFTKCLQDYAVSKTNCSITFMQNEQQETDSCSVDAFEKYFTLLTKLKSDQIGKIKKESGCYTKCRVRSFSYKVKENSIPNSTKWMSAVFLQPRSSVLEYLEEYYNFDFQDLVSSIGGYLGLFLGWSVLSIVEMFGAMLLIFNVKKYFN